MGFLTEAWGVEGDQYLSRTHLKSVRLYLSISAICILHCARELQVLSSLVGPKYFIFPIPPFHAAFQAERISISFNHCHMSPLLSSSGFLKYRFKRSITDIHSYRFL